MLSYLSQLAAKAWYTTIDLVERTVTKIKDIFIAFHELFTRSHPVIEVTRYCTILPMAVLIHPLINDQVTLRSQLVSLAFSYCCLTNISCCFCIIVWLRIYDRNFKQIK